MEKFRLFFDRMDGRLSSLAPKTIVLSACGLILLELLALFIVNPVFYRDSMEYYALTEAFRIGAYDRAFPAHLPVLYTVLSGLLAKLGIAVPRALLLTSGIATALTVFPVYYLFCTFFSPRKAAWGALLFALTPRIIHCGCAPLLDSGRFLFMLWALAMVFREKREWRWHYTLGLGIAYGCLSLVRAEGIALAGIVCVAHLVFLIRLIRPRNIKDVLQLTARLGLPLVLAGLLMLPRLVQMYHEVGVPAIDYRQVNAIRSLLRIAPAAPVSAAASNISGTLRPAGLHLLTDNARFWSSFVTGMEPWHIFMLLGIILLIRRKKWDFNYTMILAVFAMYTLLHLRMRAGAHRYLLINGCFLLPFAVTAFAEILDFCCSRDRRLLYLAETGLVIGGLVCIENSMRNLKDGHDHCFQTAAAEFAPGKPLASSVRSGQKRPVVLMVDQDRGLGCYGNLNTVFCEYYAFAPLAMTPEEVIAKGVPVPLVVHWTDRMPPPAVMQIDAIAVWRDRWVPSPALRHRLREFRGPQFDRLTVYQVLSD